MNNISHDVRIQGIDVYQGKRKATYTIRWTVAGLRFQKTFGTRKLADAERAKLVTETARGGAFDCDSGQPVAAIRAELQALTWFQHAQEFVDMKWPDVSPRHRHSTAEALTTITAAAVPERIRPSCGKSLRAALMHWAFNTTARRADPEPPAKYCEAIEWITSASLPIGSLADPATTRRILRAIATKIDGTPAAAATTNRKRAALSSAINYALELGRLTENPLRTVKVKRALVVEVLDSRTVVSHDQAKALLTAVKASNPELHAYFACLYYAALRPSEARNLRRADLLLPETGWGEILLRQSCQESGTEWTDTGEIDEERQLKHRAVNDVRPVPASPQLVHALTQHLQQFETGPDGRLFITRVGRFGRPLARPDLARPVTAATTGRVLGIARAAAFTPEQQASPLASRLYDLRHACVSTWLAAGVDSTQVAAWAGHSVTVLLRVYAHVIDGQAVEAKARISQHLGKTSDAIPTELP
jgi:integrase